jgi:hypothetical protein
MKALPVYAYGGAGLNTHVVVEYAIVEDEDFDFLNQWTWKRYFARDEVLRKEGEKVIYLLDVLRERSELRANLQAPAKDTWKHIVVCQPGGGPVVALAIVDEQDYEHLKQWIWCLHNGEALRKEGPGYIFMHLVVAARAGIPGAEHISTNHLDNRRSNLHNEPTDIDWTP